MNLDAVRRIADAVLYEGYILYPYRASAQKNRSRWQFGVVMAPGYAAADPSESSFTQTECVLEHTGQPAVDVILRFLQVQRRSTEGLAPGAAPAWDEAVEREVEFGLGHDELLGGGGVIQFAIPGGEDREPLAEPGQVGFAVRRREPLAGAVSVTATPVPGPWRAVRLRVRVENRSAPDPVPGTRDEALPTALVAAHAVVTVSGGDFISMTDPPEWAKPAVAECENTGCWPVLADPDGGRKVVLSSPIILYDHPEVAPQSTTEFCDGTEIDEMLAIRVLTMTDEEKREALATDPRTRRIVERWGDFPPEMVEKLHGVVSFSSDSGPKADPTTDTALVVGGEVRKGASVRLHPLLRADAQDLFVVGKLATVTGVFHDLDGDTHVAVTLDDDPGADLHEWYGRYLYFKPEELEAVAPA